MKKHAGVDGVSPDDIKFQGSLAFTTGKHMSDIDIPIPNDPLQQFMDSIIGKSNEIDSIFVASTENGGILRKSKGSPYPGREVNVEAVHGFLEGFKVIENVEILERGGLNLPFSNFKKGFFVFRLFLTLPRRFGWG